MNKLIQRTLWVSFAKNHTNGALRQLVTVFCNIIYQTLQIFNKYADIFAK
ncbi:MAG: hypothetical protein IJX23_03725 [Clostridia bacterium]|nr:hypothetical protein [Clostridia bacterium]